MLCPRIFDEVSRIERFLLRRAEDAFVSNEAIERQWQTLNYLDPPDFARARAEYERFVALISGCGITIDFLRTDRPLSLDSIYVRDAAVATPGGMILGSMGKPAREVEPKAVAECFQALGVPIKGAIDGAGRLEGGDVVWLDKQTVVVGRGHRTNDEGIKQLKHLLGDAIEVLAVPLPHWKGSQHVLHLMSVLSLVDHDLALVYSPLLPASFREMLLARGLRLVELPNHEFASLGCNVLAIAPRRCLMLKGNPRSRAALEGEGVEVYEFEGREIALKGSGGPTCLTLPIVREASVACDE